MGIRGYKKYLIAMGLCAVSAHAAAECGNTIGDFVWHDQNNNGIQDAGEPGIEGVKLQLTDAMGTFTLETTSGSHGEYLFSRAAEPLCEGTYFLDVIESTLPSGFSPTQVNASTNIFVDSNAPEDGFALQIEIPHVAANTIHIDLGFVSQCTGRVGDYVWHDLNHDGIQNAGEPGIPGVQLQLRNDAGTVVANATSDNGGLYSFHGICSGSYLVDVMESSIPSGLTPAPANSGADDTVDSDGFTDGSLVPVVLVSDNSSDVTVDFGYEAACTGELGDLDRKSVV